MKGFTMLFKKKDLSPITVVVRDGRYDCYGPNTARSAWLADMLMRVQGGVNESVADGTYHYNVIRKGFTLESSLTLIED
jgi:hypothetical protein